MHDATSSGRTLFNTRMPTAAALAEHRVPWITPTPLVGRHRVPHARPLHDERAARALHEHAAGVRGVAVDHVHASQQQLAAVDDFDGPRHLRDGARA